MKQLKNIYLISCYVIVLACIAMHSISINWYETLTKEDGLVEYLTAFSLLLISIVFIHRIIKHYKKMPWYWIAAQALFALVFFFGFGEEISWGQRIFNVSSSEFFLENNAQKETNLHNLVVNDKKLNKIFFAQGLTIVVGIYFLFSQFLYNKVLFIKRLFHNFSVPIPQLYQTLIFLGITALVVIFEYHKIWEIWELAFVNTLLWIFIKPKYEQSHQL